LSILHGASAPFSLVEAVCHDSRGDFVMKAVDAGQILCGAAKTPIKYGKTLAGESPWLPFMGLPVVMTSRHPPFVTESP
jgi:hypothetical protein